MAPHGLIEVYEDRVQRLEEGLTDVKVDLGVVREKVDAGFSMLSEKLDALSKLDARVTDIELRERVSTQVAVERKERRWLRVKIVGGAISALVAIIGLIVKIVVG